uniref:Protein quiver n=1 Tax=Ascaris lumbricoides TaxID=6252 RepID=A0A0M3II92_ASCLU
MNDHLDLIKEVDGIHCSTMRYGAVVVIAIVMLTVDRMECVENITIGCNSHCTLEFDKDLECWNRTLAYFSDVLVGMMKRYAYTQAGLSTVDYCFLTSPIKEVDGIHCSTMRYGAVVVIAIVMLTIDRVECVENITIGCNSHCTLEFDKDLECWNGTLAYFSDVLVGMMKRYAYTQAGLSTVDYCFLTSSSKQE